VISLSTVLFDGYPIERAMEETARAGFAHVEPAYIRGYLDFDEDAFAPTASARLRSLMRSAGLAVRSVSAHMDLSLPEARQMLSRRIEFAADLGANCLITNAGPAASRSAIVATLEAAAPACEATGVVIALENPGHGSGDLLGDGAAGAAFLAAEDLGHVRLNYDAGNVFTYSREQRRPEDDIEAALPFLACLHLKDVASEGDDWRFAALGEGDIQTAKVLRSVPATVPLTIELPLRLHRPGRRDPQRRSAIMPIGDLRQAAQASLACTHACIESRA
jgi:sugar phosphate isomerase/epimerase